MKNRLNILCVLILLVLSYSVFQSIYYASSALKDGFMFGWESAKEGKTDVDKEVNMRSFRLIPENYTKYNDSIYNVATQRYEQAHYFEVAMSVDEAPTSTMYDISIYLFMAEKIAIIVAIIWFGLLIRNINRGHIFCWQNVKRLRRLGWLLICCFLASLVPTFVNAYQLSAVVAFENYKVTFFEDMSFLTLILGIISLIIAETFAMGLKLQEEQELTI